MVKFGMRTRSTMASAQAPKILELWHEGILDAWLFGELHVIGSISLETIPSTSHSMGMGFTAIGRILASAYQTIQGEARMSAVGKEWAKDLRER